MAEVKLTDTKWLEYNTERVRSVLTAMLGKTDADTGARTEINAGALVRELRRMGLRFTPADLAIVRDALIADGTIEIVD